MIIELLEQKKEIGIFHFLIDDIPHHTTFDITSFHPNVNTFSMDLIKNRTWKIKIATANSFAIVGFKTEFKDSFLVEKLMIIEWCGFSNPNIDIYRKAYDKINS